MKLYTVVYVDRVTGKLVSNVEGFWIDPDSALTAVMQLTQKLAATLEARVVSWEVTEVENAEPVNPDTP